MKTSLRLGLFGARLAVTVPILVGRSLRRLTVASRGALMLLGRDDLPCAGCGTEVSLVGRWRCGRCRYVYDGFGFSACPVCADVPPYINCPRCGVSIRNPIA